MVWISLSEQLAEDESAARFNPLHTRAATYEQSLDLWRESPVFGLGLRYFKDPDLRAARGFVQAHVVTVRDSEVADNLGGPVGGLQIAGDAAGATLTMERSTVAQNRSTTPGPGSGLALLNGIATTLRDVSVVGNAEAGVGPGGGIYADAPLVLRSTTVAGNVFREVYRKSKSKVLVVDFDPQYNLTQLLLNESQYELLRDDGRTLWHALTPESPTSIFDIADEDLSKPKEIDSYIHTLKRLTGDPRGPRIDILPGDFRMMQMNIRGDVASQRTSRLRWDKLVADARSAYDYVVLDCNPASSFMTT